MPDRRSFLSTLSAVGVLAGSTALAMPGASAHPDAALIEFDALLTLAVERRKEFTQRCDDAYELHELPPMPNALVWRRSDFPSVWTDRAKLDELGDNAAFGIDGDDSVFVYDTDGVADALRTRLAGWLAVAPEDRFCFADRDIARVKEILDAHDAYQLEKDKAEAACGYTAALEACDAACEVVDELCRRIAGTPARSAEGVCIKVRAALAVSYRSVALLEQHQLGPLLAKVDRLPSETSELLSLSAMIDAAKLGGAFSSDRRAA